MYELQRRQAQIQEFQRKIEQAKYASDRDVVRGLVYQMANAGLIPYSLLSIVNMVSYLSPSLALNMMSSSLSATARRTLR
ncbi:MAG: hypothetical protein K8J31_30295 [Anaerolineae bacterium]|nr:hypothetical protein [Anaerolineae bacterium]